MNYKQHITAGGILTIIALAVISRMNLMSITSLDIIFIAPVVWLYSQLPDLDAEASKIRKATYVVFTIAILYSIITSQLALGLLCVICLLALLFMNKIKAFKHRGVFHSFYFGGLLALPLFVISEFLFAIGLICYWSHLILDKITTRRS